MADIISGTEMRAAILDELRQEVEAIREKHGTVPGLVTILVGENPASISYVTLKVKTALSLGFHEIQDNQPADISEEALLALIDKYNRDPSIHGILVQLPLPKHIDENKVIYVIDPDKDVDGFHPVNLGRMVIGGDAVRFLPCTPAGIQEMLVRSGVEMAGAEVVVVGRSNIVGKPISVMLGQKGPGANATVTMVHTRTKDLAEHCRRADILIVAAGVPGLVKPDWIARGNGYRRGRQPGGLQREDGKPILSGDVDFAEASKVAGRSPRARRRGPHDHCHAHEEYCPFRVVSLGAVAFEIEGTGRELFKKLPPRPPAKILTGGEAARRKFRCAVFFAGRSLA